MRLFNGILNSLSLLNDRVEARYALHDLGFLTILEEMKRDLENGGSLLLKSVSRDPFQDLDASARVEGDDEDEEDEIDPALLAALQKDDIMPVLKKQIDLFEKRKTEDDLECMFDSFNLSDADGLFSYLLKRAVSEGHHDALMKILSCLAVIPFNAPHIWELISDVLLQATLDTRKAQFEKIMEDDLELKDEGNAETFRNIMENIRADAYPTFEEIKTLLDTYTDEQLSSGPKHGRKFTIAATPNPKKKGGKSVQFNLAAPDLSAVSVITHSRVSTVLNLKDIAKLQEEVERLRKN